MGFFVINTAWCQFVILKKSSFYSFNNIIKIRKNYCYLQNTYFWRDRYVVI